MSWAARSLDVLPFETWIRRWKPRPAAAKRVFCFPWAGGGAASFRRLSVALPSDVELCAIEYPGRGSRSQEPPLTSVTALSRAVNEVAGPLLDKPYAVVGFSLGALVAFEWVRNLDLTRFRHPCHFLACARRAPHLAARAPTLHEMPDPELVAALQERFGPIPEVLLQEKELLSTFLLPLRADLAAVERHVHATGPALHCPITAVGGVRDPDVSEAELRGWACHTSSRFTLAMLDAGHFLLETPGFEETVLAAIA